MGQEAARAAKAGTPKVVEDRFHLVGTVLDGKFKIDKVVAEGGFAVVYQGVHLSLERQVAVKVLKTPAEFNDQAREEFIDKFRFEAKTIARISHPNIVQVVDFGVGTLADGSRVPYMVLEWLSGQTLDGELRARRLKGGRSPEEVLSIIRPVFEAMAYAHDEGIAHRDIKPANMMMVEGRRGASLRLLDFGIAKIMDENEAAGSGMTQTRTAMQAFSPKYAAPEQIGGARTGPWTDVHALALIVTEMLTDMPPYDGRDITQRFAEALSPTRPTPRKRKIDVGRWEDVLKRAVAVVPEERYLNAGDFLAALTEALPEARHVPLGTELPSTLASPESTVPLPPGDTTLNASAVSTDVTMGTDGGASRKLTVMLLGVALLAVLAAVGIGARSMFSKHDDTGAAHAAVHAPLPPPVPAPPAAPTVPEVIPTPPQPQAGSETDAAVAVATADAATTQTTQAPTEPASNSHRPHRPHGHADRPGTATAHTNPQSHPGGSNYTVE